LDGIRIELESKNISNTEDILPEKKMTGTRPQLATWVV
jgi:hypothetical protein